MSKLISVLVASGTFVALASVVHAAPAWDIRVPPVLGNGAGPVIDPNATQGQWFLSPSLPGTVPTQSSRPYEFYDNTPGNGGGFAGHLAVQGNFAGFQTGIDATGQTVVTGYAVVATITNDLGTGQGTARLGTNSHGENLRTPQGYVGDMVSTMLTIHWADDGIFGNFNPGGPNVGPESNTFAINNDSLGWYSFTSTGGYQVPAWDFGTIALGASVTKTLAFGLYAPVPIGSINPIIADMLIARSNDLKIGQYFQSDPLLAGILDTGAAYPIGGFIPTSNDFANSSVFFIPTPGAAALLMFGAGVATRRRRTR